MVVLHHKIAESAKNRRNSVPITCKRRRNSVKYLCLSVVSAAASVSWSINSCFFGFGNRVKNKGGFPLLLFALLPLPVFDRMSGSFFTVGFYRGHFCGRTPPIGTGYFGARHIGTRHFVHYSRAPPTCLLFCTSKRSGTLEMNEKRETQNFCENSVSLDPQPVLPRLGNLTGIAAVSLRRFYAQIAFTSRANTGLTPILPMTMTSTIVTQKDLFSATFQELIIGQETVERARSKMHSIIGSLPNGEKPEEIRAPSTTRHNGECCTCQTRRPLLEKGNTTRNRPILTAAMPEPSSQPPIETTSKKTRVKRTSEAEIRKAVKLVYDENLTQKEAEIACNLPPGTLSRRKGKQIMDGYRKEWGTPTIVKSQRGVRRKDVEDGNRYEKR